MVKWFLFSITIGGVVGASLAIEYYRSISPMEEIPISTAKSNPFGQTRPNIRFQIPTTPAAPTPTPTPITTPTPMTPTPTLTGSQIFAMNDRGEISDAEARRLLSTVVYEGESEGRLIDEAKSILDRVWSEEGQGRRLFITITHVPIDSPDTDEMIQFDFEEPNKATIVIPNDPTELSNGLVYAISFASLVMASADDSHDIPQSKFRSIYDYATDYEVSEIWDDCGQLDMIYCSLFMTHSRSPS